jgi:pyruvate dehydrogenase E2 component (dihydrolipoamide acetyltransferase)
MPEAVLLIPQSGTTEGCVIGAWKKSIGDAVAKGDVLFDYRAGEHSFEYGSSAEGVLLDILYHDGDEVEALKPICIIGAEGEDISVLKARRASPRAVNTADRLGVFVEDASPSGPGGRVIERDIIALAESPAAFRPQSSDEKEKTEKEYVVPAMAGPYSDATLTRIRRDIAVAVQDSLCSTAQSTNHHSFDATEILIAEKAFKESDNPALSDISAGDMILFAVSRILAEYPDMNAHLVYGDTIRLFANVNLGVVVSSPRGLIVPTLFDADTKSLIEISAEVKQLAVAARSGGLDPGQLQGATFTVSNLSDTGVEMFTPILNAPQIGALGVCAPSDRIRPAGGSIDIYTSMGLSLTYDHRAVDGAPASQFAKALCDKLEQFSLMLDS